MDNNDKNKNIDMGADIIDFGFEKKTDKIIKVIGVGGGGGNAVTHMYKEGIHNVSFALCNTDAQAMEHSPIDIRIQLGTGLGAGNDPEVARIAAEESSDKIEALLKDGTMMTFITAGMGGGTGTGASPVVAGLSKSLDILTVGIVTLPFKFEGRPKIIQALKGVDKLAENVDALLVVNNEKLKEHFADFSIGKAFAVADDTLAVAAKGISEIITVHGLMNLDFADVRKVLKNGGVAIMSSGYGEGENRLEIALEAALTSPLITSYNVFESKKVLFNIYSSEESTLILSELEAMDQFTSKFNTNIEVIWGTAIDPTLDQKVKITILAAGFHLNNVPGMDEFEKERTDQELADEDERRRKEEDEARQMDERIQTIYGKDAIGGITKNFFTSKPEILTEDQLNNDKIIDNLENNPVYKRDNSFNLEETKSNKKDNTLF